MNNQKISFYAFTFVIQGSPEVFESTIAAYDEDHARSLFQLMRFPPLSGHYDLKCH